MDDETVSKALANVTSSRKCEKVRTCWHLRVGGRRRSGTGEPQARHTKAAKVATTIHSDDPSHSGYGADPRAYLSARSASRTPVLIVAGFVLAILSLGVAAGSLPAMVILAALLTFGVGFMIAIQRDLTIQHSLLLGLSHFVGAALLV